MKMVGIVGLMAGSVALVGCAKPAPQANPPTVETAKAMPTTSNPTDKCGTFTDTGTYTMKVNAAFQVTDRTDPHGASFINLKSKKPKDPPGQLDTIIALKDGESADIEIDLKGQELFNTGPDGTASPMNLKPDQAPIFCGAKVSADKETLTFTVFRSGSATYSAYSLAVVVPDKGKWKPGDPALFAIIDPIVDNDGYQGLPPPPSPPPPH